MKDINKSLLILIAFSKLLFYSDAAQTPPQMPNPARGNASSGELSSTRGLRTHDNAPPLNRAYLPRRIQARVGRLTHDKVFDLVIKMGFALNVVELERRIGQEKTPSAEEARIAGVLPTLEDLRRLDQLRLADEIRQIRGSFWKTAWSLRDIYIKELTFGLFQLDKRHLKTKEDYERKIRDLQTEKGEVLKNVCNKCFASFQAISGYYRQMQDPKTGFPVNVGACTVTFSGKEPYEKLVTRIRSLTRQCIEFNQELFGPKELNMLKWAIHSASRLLAEECQHTVGGGMLTSRGSDPVLVTEPLWTVVEDPLAHVVQSYQRNKKEFAKTKEATLKGINVHRKALRRRLSQIKRLNEMKKLKSK